MIQKHSNLIIIFSVLLLLSGCLKSDLTFQVRYPDISGLKQDDLVYFDNNEIGKVVNISYTQQGDYLVDLSIVPEFKNATTLDSEFFIGASPINLHQRAVLVLQEKPGGAVLEKGVIVEGSVKTGFLEKMLSEIQRNTGISEEELRYHLEQLQKSLNTASQNMSRDMEEALKDLLEKLATFGEEVKKVPNSYEVKELERSIKQFGEELKKTNENVRSHIQNEIIPKLRKKLDQLRRQLELEDREEEIEEIDRQVKDMTMV